MKDFESQKERNLREIILMIFQEDINTKEDISTIFLTCTEIHNHKAKFKDQTITLKNIKLSTNKTKNILNKIKEH